MAGVRHVHGPVRRRGSVVALAVGPAGLVAGGVGITPEDGTTYPMVAVRTEADWTPTNLPNTPGWTWA